MAKRRREPDSDGIAEETVECNTVFVDTSLDTHIAMLVSSSDTILDLKKKLVLEHMQCFPKIGEIRIHSLKVKRRANYYHLPDIMVVWSAFHGVKGSWFLSADVSGAPACHLNQNSLELGTSDGMKMDVRNVDDDCRSLSSDVNRIQTLPTSLADGVTENNVVSEMIDGYKVEKSLEKNTGLQNNTYSQVKCMRNESRPKKKRKIRHMKDVCHDPSLEESPNMIHASGQDTSMTEIVAGGNSMIDAEKEGPEGVVLYEQQRKPVISEAAAEVGVRRNQSNIEDKVVPEGIAADKSNLGRILDSENLPGSGKRKEDTISDNIISENLIASKLESELGQDVPAEQSRGVSEVPDVSARSINTHGATGDVRSDGNKRKKKKSQKTDAKVQGTTDVKQSKIDESTKLHETHELEKKDEERELVLNQDDEIIMPSNSKASVHADDPKEERFSPHLPDANAMESDVSSVGKKKKKKKKRATKSANTNLEKSGIEQTDNGISGSSGVLSPSCKNIQAETDKGESISCHKGKDVQMTMLDDSTKDASDKAHGANANEGDFMTLTQTEQTLEDVIAEEKKNQSSAGYCDAAIGKENPVVQVNQVEKDSENIETKDREAKKKIKDIQMKLLNGSTKYASEMSQGTNIDEANSVISTQNKQTLEDRITEEKKMEKKDQSSADNCDAAREKENQVVDFDPVEKNSKNTENKEKKAKKKIKKRKVKASGVQENLLIKDQKVGNEVSTTEGDSISLANSKEESQHLAKSQVLSRTSEEKPEEMRGSAVNTDDLAGTPENGVEGINFKQYFVPGQCEDQVDSSDEVKEATKSNEEMKSQKKVEQNGLLSLSISTKLQNSHKSFENHEGENKSQTGKRLGDSAQNSDREEVIPNSSKRSIEVSENGVKNSSPSEMRETTHRKSSEILAASSYPNKKKPSLDISSSKKSMTVPKNSGSKRLQPGLNVTNNRSMNTLKKNSLLSGTGPLFQDSSSGGSEDENETVHLNVRAHSPSGTSSLSDHSAGESDLSQDSPRNVSNDMKGISSGRKNIDLSASKDMTMDMILRSSKRFKKAKLHLDSQNDEQNESQQVEFVPESQPV